jgi:medium-chain acyl-[acyl-carrier-protein] hydrolase
MSNNAALWFPLGLPLTTAKVYIFCFPYAGGGASIYRDWIKQTPAAVQLCPVQLPGREARMSETPFTNLESLLAAVGNAMAPYLDRPFALFGHSMGGLISYLLANYLRQQKLPLPCQLFISGYRAPQIPDPDPTWHLLPDAEFKQRLYTLNGIPIPKDPAQAAVFSDILDYLLPMIRADFTIIETYHYQPQPPLPIPVTVFGGDQDPHVTANELQDWQTTTNSTFQYHLLPGDHFFINSAQAIMVQTMARALQRYY